MPRETPDAKPVTPGPITSDAKVTVPDDAKKPAKVARIETRGADRQVQMRWQRVDGVDAYQVMRSVSRDGDYTQVGALRGNTNFVDTKVQPGTEYWYKIRTVDGSANTDSDPVSVRTRGTAARDEPKPEAQKPAVRTPMAERPTRDATPAPSSRPARTPATARPQVSREEPLRKPQTAAKPSTNSSPVSQDRVTTEAVYRRLSSENRARLQRLPAAEQEKRLEGLRQQAERALERRN